MSGAAYTQPEGVRAELLAIVGGMASFTRSFSARTFTPERRAAREIEDAVASITEAASVIYDAGGNADDVSAWVEGYKKRWTAYQRAGARTMNWMVTGPANFPVERNEKRNRVEHARMVELIDYRDGVDQWIRRRKSRAAAIAARDAALAADQGGHKEAKVDGIRIVENTAVDRLQIIFPDKPSSEERAILKARGFKWAPSMWAWQRKLTNNARDAAKCIVKRIAEGRCATVGDGGAA